MSLYPIEMVLEKNVDWHLRMVGNEQTVLFKFVQTLARGKMSYTIRLHQDYMIGENKLTEFEFKALLGEYTYAYELCFFLNAILQYIVFLCEQSLLIFHFIFEDTLLNTVYSL